MRNRWGIPALCLARIRALICVPYVRMYFIASKVRYPLFSLVLKNPPKVKRDICTYVTYYIGGWNISSFSPFLHARFLLPKQSWSQPTISIPSPPPLFCLPMLYDLKKERKKVAKAVAEQSRAAKHSLAEPLGHGFPDMLLLYSTICVCGINATLRS